MKIYKICGEEVVCNEWSTYELILDDISLGEENSYGAKMLLISGNNLRFPVAFGGDPMNETDLIPGIISYFGVGRGETAIRNSAITCSTANSDLL